MDEQRKKYIEGLRDYFDERADEYVSACYEGVGRYPSNYYRERLITALIEQRFPQNRKAVTLLDLGCGAGHLLVELSKRGYHVEGIDMSAKMVDLSRKRLREAGFSEMLVRQEELFELIEKGSPGKQYDGIVMAGVIGYLPDVNYVLGKVKRLLKPDGGALVCNVGNRLFDLFTLNRHSIEFFEWILNEINVPDAVKEEVSGRITKLLRPDEVRSPGAKTFQPLETGPKRYFKNKEYDWNPLNYHQRFGQFGFDVKAVRYFHYHPLPTRFEAEYPELMTELGTKLETIEDNWLGALLCSGAVVLAETKPDSKVG